MKRNIIFIGMALGIALVQAQDLRTEITVDRTVQPVLREMHRISGVTPTIPAPNIIQKSIEAAEYSDPGTIESEIGVLPAAAWADSIPHSPYRGYASFGYLPLYNLGVNAGYRILDSDKVGLGLWAQYNGESYNGDIPHFDGALFTNHSFTLGGNMHLRLTRNSLFAGDGYATYKSIRVPYFLSVGGDELRRSYTQDVMDIYGHGRWSSRTENVVYALDGALGYTALGDQCPDMLRTVKDPVKQAYGRGGINLGIADDDSLVPWLGVNIDYTMLRTRDIPYMLDALTTAYRTEDIKQGNVNPYMRFSTETGLQGHIGAKVGFGSGYNSKTTVAPDIMVSWTPVSFVKMYAKADGGQYINFMDRLLEINPYLDPSVAYGRTNMPLILRGGISIGPYDGMELGVYGGYAMARDYLSPLITIWRTGLMTSVFESKDVNSWYFGAHVGYSYHQYFTLGFDIKYGGSDSETHSWYEWIDAPKVVSNVKIGIHPIEPLDITLSYDMRYDRKARSIVYPYNEVSLIVYKGIPNLGTVNQVNIGASYRVSDQITAFMKLENVLNERYKLISGMPSPGICGIIGFAYKF